MKTKIMNLLMKKYHISQESAEVTALTIIELLKEDPLEKPIKDKVNKYVEDVGNEMAKQIQKMYEEAKQIFPDKLVLSTVEDFEIGKKHVLVALAKDIHATPKLMEKSISEHASLMGIFVMEALMEAKECKDCDKASKCDAIAHKIYLDMQSK